MDEDPLQRQIYFLIFVESLEMIFSHCTETCEVLLDYPIIEEEDIKYFSKKAIRYLLHANIDVHSRWLIAYFPADGIICIKKLQITLCKHDFCLQKQIWQDFSASHK